MLMEQRNLLMRIRAEDTSMRKYQIANVGFGELDVVERKLKGKQTDKYDKTAKNREIIDYSRGQKAHQNCRLCLYSKQKNSYVLVDCKIGESEHWIVVFPTGIKPLSPMGAKEAVTHF